MENLIDKLEQLHNEDKFQEIIDIIESLPKEQWDNEIFQRLASAKNNVGEYEEAVALLKVIEDECVDNHRWHFKMGYAFYYMDLTGKALRYFKRALELKPEDEDTLMFIDWCREELAAKMADSSRECR